MQTFGRVQSVYVGVAVAYAASVGKTKTAQQANQDLQAAATAESLTQAQAGAVLVTLDEATLNGMIDWLHLPANQGADEIAWRSAFPVIAGLDDPRTRFTMRIIADAGFGRVEA